MSASAAMREILFGFGNSNLMCLPASAAEKGSCVPEVEGVPEREGAGTTAGKASEATLLIETG